MHISKAIAYVCIVSGMLGMYQLHAVTAQDLIRNIDDGEQNIKKNNADMENLKTTLTQSLQSINEQLAQLQSYIALKDKYKGGINSIKTSIKTEQDKIFAAIQNVPTLPTTVAAVLRPIVDNYQAAMKDIDAMFTSIGNLLDTANKNMSSIKEGISKSVNTTLPTIIQKGNETIAKLEALKERAPAIAAYVTGVTEQISH